MFGIYNAALFSDGIHGADKLDAVVPTPQIALRFSGKNTVRRFFRFVLVPVALKIECKYFFLAVVIQYFHFPRTEP